MEPPVHCPAIHVIEGPPVPLATAEELTPIVGYLRDPRAKPTTRRFPKGTVQRDGRLDFCKQGLGPSGLREVLAALGRGHPWLQHVLLGTNALGDEGAEALGDALATGLTVQTLYLGCNRISGVGVAALARGLARHAPRALWLKRNPIGDDGLDALIDVAATARIRTLDVTNCALGDAGVARLVNGLARRGARVAHLFLGGNGLVDPGPVARWLATPGCPLESLFVPASRLGDDGASAIFEALATNSRLRALDLASNDISARALAVAAKHAPSFALTYLNLGASPATEKLGERRNTFGDDAVPHLAALLSSSLEHLGLAGGAMRERTKDLGRLGRDGLTSRGARALLTTSNAAARRPAIAFGRGIAERLRRLAAAGPPREVPDDMRKIASVYR